MVVYSKFYDCFVRNYIATNFYISLCYDYLHKEMIKMVINTKGEKKVIEIPIISIRPCKNQARVYFKRDEMQELAISIRENGILQPLTVRRVSKNEYELIAGERRLRAASMCGMKSVPCIVVNCDEDKPQYLAYWKIFSEKILISLRKLRVYASLLLPVDLLKWRPQESLEKDNQQSQIN